MRYRKLANPTRIACFHGHRCFDKDVFAHAPEPCPYTHRRCLKDNPICEMSFERQDMIICPSRFEENCIVFRDALHRVGYWGNKFFVRREVRLSGSFFDYVLRYPSKEDSNPYVFIEVQALDSSGSAWWEVERLKRHFGYLNSLPSAIKHKPVGANWQMSVKTLFHELAKKARVCSSLHKPLFVVVQDGLWDYIQNRYSLPKEEFGMTWLIYTMDESHSLRIRNEYSMSCDGFRSFMLSEKVCKADDVRQKLFEVFKEAEGESRV